MRLLIVSNMEHFRREDGTIVGHGATARELSELARLFTEVRHVACLHEGPAPMSALPYEADNVQLVAVPPAGGSTLASKLEILRQMPMYARTIKRELRGADAVHVRCPSNISLCALAILSISDAPPRRWIKYAGAWDPGPGLEPASYKLQRRWLLHSGTSGAVTINGTYAAQPAHVHSFVNPCLNDHELASGRAAVLRKRLGSPISLLFVGHLGAAKNPRIAIEILAELRRGNVHARLDIVGGGREQAELQRLVDELDLRAFVTLHGPLPRDVLNELYTAAHFLVLPSRTEGWPKVLSEGMAFGVIPIATAVGSIAEVLGHTGVGRALEQPPTAAAFAAAIHPYMHDLERWRREVALSLIAAESFSYSAYLVAVSQLLKL